MGGTHYLLSVEWEQPSMAKMIQIRNVPEDVHRKLKARAERSGMTLSGMLLREVIRLADTPTMEELLERIRQREPVDISGDSIVKIIHDGRKARTRSLMQAFRAKQEAQ
jgi:hypothetical protein